MATLTLPSGRVVEFGAICFSRECVEFMSLARRVADREKAQPGADLDEGEGLRMMELTWVLSVQGLMCGGLPRDQAEEVMAEIPLSAEWMEKLRDALGIG